MLYKELPYKVAINEAIELAKKYSEMFDRISIGYSGEYFD